MDSSDNIFGISGDIESMRPPDFNDPLLSPSEPLPDDPLFLTVGEVAGLYRVSVRTVWRMRERGELPAPVRVSKTIIRWRYDDIIKHIYEMPLKKQREADGSAPRIFDDLADHG